MSDGNSGLYHQTLRLGEELSQEHLKVVVLEQDLRGLHLQGTTNFNLPREREGLRRAYYQDSPLRYRHASAAVLSDLFLN
ncbi:hypothetical protein LIER_39492 [Lithospermum erythrorhizon]|uniref:Uncharacterized protein n=1 Tax=Lithospermum erythrorhizon TaxID=34254 RepID=A0AAV3QHA5_LITER